MNEWNALRWIKIPVFLENIVKKRSFFAFAFSFSFRLGFALNPTDTTHRCVYQPKQITPWNTSKYHMNVLIFKHICHIWSYSCWKLQFICQRKIDSFSIFERNFIQFKWNDSILSKLLSLLCISKSYRNSKRKTKNQKKTFISVCKLWLALKLCIHFIQRKTVTNSSQHNYLRCETFTVRLISVPPKMYKCTLHII